MQFPKLPEDADAPAGIGFDAIDVQVPPLDEHRLADWLSDTAGRYGFSIASYTCVFCSDSALHAMNVERLDHDTLTDIITFDLRDDVTASVIVGECYISLDRIYDNARELGVETDLELRRVIVHGVLHLCGLGDKTAEDAKLMRAAEDEALALY